MGPSFHAKVARQISIAGGVLALEADMITVTPHHFRGRDEAVSQVRERGLYLAEADLSQAELTRSAHVHPYDVEIYLLDGVLELDEPRTGLRHLLEAGDRAVVPAGTLHAESCPGPFRAVFGFSEDPASLTAAGLPKQP